MIAEENIQKNIRQFTIWFLPIIIISKVVRWTVMVNQLVYMSMGINMIIRMNAGDIVPFHASLFSDVSNAGSVIMSNSEALFSAINIFGFTTYVEWEWFFSVVFNLIFYFIIRSYYVRNPLAGWRENTFIYLNLAILNIFCLNMSKEPLQLITFLMMYAALMWFRRFNAKSVALAVVLVLSVLYCRKYYALILGYFFVLQVVVNRWFSNIETETKQQRQKLYLRILMLFVMFGVMHFFFLSFLAENNEDTYDEMVAANTREGTGAVSEITPIFTGNRVMLALDYFVKIFRLMFPVELIFRGKFTYFFLIIYQGLLALFLVRAFRLRRRTDIVDVEVDVDDRPTPSPSLYGGEENGDDVDEEEDEDEEDEEDEEERSWETASQKDARTAALYLYLAFLLCSAAFEPDFGSWIRHQGVAFPIILLIL